MIPADREWYRLNGASEDKLSALRAAAPEGLPSEYFDLLAQSNGGEGPFPVQPYSFVLSSADEALNDWTSGTFAEFFPGLFVFGTNGGGEAFAFDTTVAGTRVVYFDMTNTNLAESVVEMTTSMGDFIDLIGRDAA